MDKNGKTKAGKQRWRCLKCGVSTINQNDELNSDLEAFLHWLLSKDRQLDMPGGGRGFRRRCKKFWNIWPIASEIHNVIHVDGI